MLLPSRRARTYPHHARQRRWSETLGCGAPMASTSSPTLISPLRESSNRTESLMGLAKPSRSFASSLTSRTSRPTGISASGASLSLSVTVTPPFARVILSSAATLSFWIPGGTRGPVTCEVERFFHGEDDGLCLRRPFGPALVVVSRGKGVQVRAERGVGRAGAGSDRAKRDDRLRRRTLHSFLRHERPNLPASRVRGVHLNQLVPEHEGQHERVHEAVGMEGVDSYPYLVAGRLLRDEVLGPADPTPRRHGSHQLAERLVPPKSRPAEEAPRLSAARSCSTLPLHGSARSPPVLLLASYDFSDIA